MWKKIAEVLYEQRFLLSCLALLFALFGPVFFPLGVPNRFEILTYTLFFLSGINLTRKRPAMFWALCVLFVLIFTLNNFITGIVIKNSIISGLLFLSFLIISTSLLLQILHSKIIDTGILIASFSILIIIGLIGAKIFIFIEAMQPGSFSNLSAYPKEDLTYFSFITQMTVGYGDIAPVSAYARKVTILFSLIGHFYSVVIMAIIIAKYLKAKDI
jgi:voltage-gated potassium channel